MQNDTTRHKGKQKERQTGNQRKTRLENADTPANTGTDGGSTDGGKEKEPINEYYA